MIIDAPFTTTPQHGEEEVNRRFQLSQAIRYISQCQLKNGAIPWFENEKLDPWDHIEAIMALAIGQKKQACENGFRWLAEQQNPDGSWYARYYGSTPEHLDHAKIETNFVAYIATGVWHFDRIFNDSESLLQFYPMVVKAINFVVQLQTEEGDIQWATSEQEALPKDALITACSSILRSLECAIKLAKKQKDTHHSDKWKTCYLKLRDVLLFKPERFDRTWTPKTRFSMDWFYPILSGVLTPQAMQNQLSQRWQHFTQNPIGCLCVSDQPWVTVAETCELIMALKAAGRDQLAQYLHKKISYWQDTDGGFWTGYNFKNHAIWPVEKTTWTAAAFVLAADALYHYSEASELFTAPASISP